MRIIINTAHQRFGGAVQVALSFIYECRNFPENEYHILVGPGLIKSVIEKDFPRNFSFYYFDFGIINFATTFKINHRLRKIEKKIQPDCVIATSGPTYFNSRVPQIIGFNLPLYIYPESPFIKNLSIIKLTKLFLKKRFHFYYFMREATVLTTQTIDVCERVKKLFSDIDVFTINNTINSFYYKNIYYTDKLPEKHKNEIRFITISAYYAHKNLEIISKISKLLKERETYNIVFVLTLNDEDFTKKVNPYNDINIVNVGPIKPDECPSLYRECDFMFLPTLAECFSASYPEAMAMKKPIITTDLGFARSICGNAAIYFEPMNAEDAAYKIEELVNNKEMQENLISAGLEQLKKFETPASRAAKYLELCKRLVDEDFRSL